MDFKNLFELRLENLKPSFFVPKDIHLKRFIDSKDVLIFHDRSNKLSQ